MLIVNYIWIQAIMKLKVKILYEIQYKIMFQFQNLELYNYKKVKWI